MANEGVIKFQSAWEKSNALPAEQLLELNEWRQKLYARKLIGANSDGVGYGNISQRDGASFIITGSGTGGLLELTSAHFTRVTSYDISANSLSCSGPINASSESLTHAALYAASSRITAVIHIHSAAFWRVLLNRVPTTDSGAAYGTPAMASEVGRLVREQDAEAVGLIAMAGHEDGILAFGASLEVAGTVLLNRIKKELTSA